MIHMDPMSAPQLALVHSGRNSLKRLWFLSQTCGEAESVTHPKTAVSLVSTTLGIID